MTSKKIITDFFKAIKGGFAFYKNSNVYNKIIKGFYKELKAIKKVKFILKKVPFSETSLSKSHFVSKEAKKALKKIKHSHESTFTIGYTDITVSLLTLNNVSAQKRSEHMHKVFKLLSFMLGMSTLEMETLHIVLFLHDDKKIITDKYEILSPKHVNTAVTYACSKNGQIFLYRSEEWFKVLSHELMHSLCLDFSGLDIKTLQKKVKNIFNIKSEFEISESYSEFWATIINCAFLSFDISTSFKSFKENITMMIDFERIFSLFQCVKILKYMKIDNYESFINEQNNLYEEKTNVFVYYILKTILLYRYDDFMSLCHSNNPPANPVLFYKSPNNLNNLYEFIFSNYYTNGLLDDFKIMEGVYSNIKNKVLLHTMRMTLFEKR